MFRSTRAAWPSFAAGRVVAAVLCLSACTGEISDSGTSLDPSSSGGASGAGTSGGGASNGGASNAGRGTSGAPGAAGKSSSTSGAGGTSEPNPSGAGASGMAVRCSADESAKPTIAARIRRLTRLEMENTLGDLLGAASGALASELEADTLAIGYSTGDERSVSSNYVEALSAVAVKAAANLPSAVESQALIASCYASAASAATCARTFIADFGARSYRRPLTQAELDGLFSVYTAGRATAAKGDEKASVSAGLGYAVRALLQSSSFIFRPELGAAGATGDVVSLTPYERGAALSYALIASAPDASLRESAASGALADADELVAQGRRLLATYPERFASQAERFIREWLSIDVASPAWNKDAALYPGAGQPFKLALDQETQLFLRDWAERASLPELLTSRRGYVSRDNAAVYDLAAKGSEFEAVTLDPQRRAGVLTLPSFLGSRAHTDASSPVLRGLAIMRQLLCLQPPPVPDMVPPLPPADQGAVKTTRERYEKHTSIAFCAACHATFDPMGFAFEHYDAVGHYREQENGASIDASGAIAGTASSDGPVTDAIDLAEHLATSPEVQACFVRQTYRFTFGRLESAGDACALEGFEQSFRERSLNVRELMLKLATSAASFQRLPLSAEP
jgi:hypothetical protein